MNRPNWGSLRGGVDNQIRGFGEYAQTYFRFCLDNPQGCIVQASRRQRQFEFLQHLGSIRISNANRPDSALILSAATLGIIEKRKSLSRIGTYKEFTPLVHGGHLMGVCTGELMTIGGS